MTTVHTRTEAKLLDAEETFANDPERAELIARARRFKASWIELAEGLTDAKKSGSYKRWGYESFEDYAKKELHLRQETVDKLTGSFLFLKKSAPSVLTRDGVGSSIPSYQAIDFLRRVEEKPDVDDGVVREIRQRVLEGGESIAAVKKEYNDVVFPISKEDRKKRDLDGLRNVAKRLRELLGESRVAPRDLSGDLSTKLDKLLEWLETQEEKAA